jgi:hypothetical protein
MGNPRLRALRQAHGKLTGRDEYFQTGNIKEGAIRKMTLSREANRPVSEMVRVISIDVFRGLTIFLMIFVNAVAWWGRNIPLWLKHVPSDVDGMTLPDIVFPCFLFVVGMAIPYAIGARIKRGESLFRIWKHIFIRTFSLLVLGVFMVNAEGGYNQEAMRIPLGLWGVLVFICAILVWNAYPGGDWSGSVVYGVPRGGKQMDGTTMVGDSGVDWMGLSYWMYYLCRNQSEFGGAYRGIRCSYTCERRSTFGSFSAALVFDFFVRARR